MTSDYNFQQDFNLELKRNNFKTIGDINKYTSIAQQYYNNNNINKCIEYLLIALNLDPQNSITLSKLGYAYYKLGRLPIAIDYFKHSLKNNINNYDALNFWALALLQQGKWFSLNDSEYLNKNLNKLSFKFHGFFYISMIINNILLNRNQLNTLIFKDIVKEYDGDFKTSFRTLPKFAQVWLLFLNKLNNQILKTKNIDKKTNFETIYHIGDSHCLSFVNQKIKLNNKIYKILPKLISGAKAWHFANDEINLSKKLFINHIKNIEVGSKVFVSFGEIDCRPDEGIIIAYSKTDLSKKNLIEIIQKTTKNYVEFCCEQFKARNVTPYILGVQAPIIKKEDTKKADLLKKIIKKFNLYLKNICHEKELNFIDTFEHTRNNNFISNKKYMLDNCHLNFKFIKVIEKIYSKSS